jgi:hypothetical protein
MLTNPLGGFHARRHGACGRGQIPSQWLRAVTLAARNIARAAVQVRTNGNFETRARKQLRLAFRKRRRSRVTAAASPMA